MKNILIVGGGFAGVWSAAGAVRVLRAAQDDEIRVTLISDSDDLVIRPRLYESEPDRMRVALDRVLGPIGVERVAAKVTDIDVESRTVNAVGRDGQTVELSYDRLVLATGSQLVRPAIPGGGNIFDIDTLAAASALADHVRQLPHRSASPGQYTAVVVGAGFTGLEIATELGDRLRAVAPSDQARESVRVILVDRADVLGPELGDAPRPYIAKAIDELKIEQRLGVTVASAATDQIVLSDGEVLPAATVVWTAGMAASPLTAKIPGERDRFGRLNVDPQLRVAGVPDVFAAGDTAVTMADAGHTTIQSCQHALPMGKFAGHNVAADLLGGDLLPFTPDPYSNALDLGAAGAITTTGWERTVETTGQEAKSMKQAINSQWIYPPVDSAEALLAQAGKFSNG
ncbi:FAD-dependent oxidoreductase [Mycobacterium sp. 21AC1]|uniref:NAD(P)/FAD-dependent oxidoreductase n=1 Tax=[Mycobacterium] appelbergii TaxID=2939269 RepID=UPI00293910A0|nr:FAD-dependent oxidoreductase [Mycobacterium sp. 21AC1]MDV3124140.1 FAD-dependent oxidoreductase [Mycobacterium sp. 21AC1]